MLSVHALSTPQASQTSEEIRSLRRKIDHDEVLRMSNHPRIATLEASKRDAANSIHYLEDWARDRRFELANHHMRVRQLEGPFPDDHAIGLPGPERAAPEPTPVLPTPATPEHDASTSADNPFPHCFPPRAWKRACGET